MEVNTSFYPRIRWFVMLAIFFAYVGLGTMLVAFSSIIGIVSEEFSVTPGQMSFFALGIFILTNAIFTIISGILFDRFGIKKVLFVGTAIMLIGAAFSPMLTQSITGIIIMRILVGIGAGPVAGCIAVVGAKWFPLHERSIYTGVVSAGICVGIALSFIIVNIVLNITGGDWRAAVNALVVGPIASMIFVLLYTIFANDSKLPQSIEAKDEDANTHHEFANIVRQPIFYLLIITGFCYTWCLNAFTDLTPGYIAIDAPMGLGYGAVAAGTFMLLVQLGNILGGFFSGVIVEKIFKGNVKPVIVGAFIIQAITVFLVKFTWVTDSDTLFRIVLFIIGFTIMLTMSNITTFISTTMPSAIVGKVFSIIYGIGLIIGSIGVSVGSGILHFTGSYQGPILIISAVAIIGAIAASFYNKPKFG